MPDCLALFQILFCPATRSAYLSSRLLVDDASLRPAPPPRVTGLYVRKHGIKRGHCELCGISALRCPHGKREEWCKDCGGSALCPHGKRRENCE
eukprot:1173655-Rhodomonas_salina.2